MAQKLTEPIPADDAVPSVQASIRPELIAATTVNGNVPVDYCTENSLRVFDIAVPVGLICRRRSGATTSIPRGDIQSSNAVHGGYLDIPPSRSTNSR
jgi:purine nucleosidase/ribosylpyrimidine nucleosidase